MTTHVHIRLHVADGRPRLWWKGGRIHPLPAELAAMWVGSFKPELFQVLADGRIVPRGSDPEAVDILSVEVAGPADAQG